MMQLFFNILQIIFVFLFWSDTHPITIKFVLAKILGRLIIFFKIYFTNFWAFEKMFPQQ